MDGFAAWRIHDSVYRWNRFFIPITRWPWPLYNQFASFFTSEPPLMDWRACVARSDAHSATGADAHGYCAGSAEMNVEAVRSEEA